MNIPKKITVLGAGSWGTALAIHLASQHQTYLWGYNSAHIKLIQKERLNQRYLPNIAFPDNLQCTDSLYEAIKNTDAILFATPSTVFTDLLEKIKSFNIPILPPVICATKGIDQHDNQFLSETFAIHFPNIQYAVLSGPSFANEVAQNYPTAIAIAAETDEIVNLFIPFFHFGTFRVYGNNDIKGVQLAGAYKNIIAIATGISDGLGFGANARAALITRGLAEMSRLGIRLGGEIKTFMGLAGLGDLVLTATDNQSRNRRFGLLLGKGYLIHDAFKEIGQVVEGTNIAKSIYELGKKHNVDLPIANQIYNILHKNMLPMTSLESLLAREQKSE